MKEKVLYYLDRPEERREIAARARARALKEHTYEHRMREMLSVIFASKFEHLRSREQSGPWANILRRAKPHRELYDRCVRTFERGEAPKLEGLVSDIMSGKGKLTETEQKLLFLHHITSQIIHMKKEEGA